MTIGILGTKKNTGALGYKKRNFSGIFEQRARAKNVRSWRFFRSLYRGTAHMQSLSAVGSADHRLHTICHMKRFFLSRQQKTADKKREFLGNFRFP